MYRNEVPGACCQKTLLRFRARNGLLREYALMVFRSHLQSGVFQKYSRWITNIAHLAAERFIEVEFPLPPLAEQRRIVAEVERRLSVIAAMDAAVAANLKRAERLRQAILKRAFEGRLVPQEPSDEPAAALLERIRAARQENVASPLSNGRRGRSRKAEAAAQPTGRALPASEPPRGAEQLRMDEL